jgi:GNAT superfamily N-acetyltransferase
MNARIREAIPADEAEWRRLWAGYLAFYDVPLAAEVTDATWARINDPQSRLAARVAEVDGALIGFAVWHRHVASWSLKDDCYLEDLFVDDPARGQGIGRALIEDLVAVATEGGCGRIYWHTDEDNARARALYDSFAPADGHIRYRLAL